MNDRTDIEMFFSSPVAVRKAREIAGILIDVYMLNDYHFLPFDDMEMVNSDGWVHYPGRYVRYENASSFSRLWRDYRLKHRELIRFGEPDPERYAQARRLKSHISTDPEKGHFMLADCADIRQEVLIEHQYFQDFYSMFCFLLATLLQDVSFEGMRRIHDSGSYSKRILTHAVYDGQALTFEQMEGLPAFHSLTVSWTRRDDRFMKSSLMFPCIRVDILTDQRDSLEGDDELEQWIRQVNHADMEMVSAKLCFTAPSVDPWPHIMLYASSRALCVKYRDELLKLLSARGYKSNLFSLLRENECPGSHVVIPDSATMIGDKAFRGRTGLESVCIPDSVTGIGEDAFHSCTSLKEVDIPDSVTEIDSFAFNLCTNLTTVRLPKKLRKLSTGVFSHCEKLKDIVLPESIREIDRFAFSGCESLKTLIIPRKVRKIDDEAFRKCKNLENIEIPDTVIKFGKDVFTDCSPRLTIHGKAGSEAERYAAAYNLTFRPVP